MKQSVSDALKRAFEGFRFFTVAIIKTKPADIITITRDGVTTWNNEPVFPRMLQNILPTDEVSYGHYFGFIEGDGLYFQASDFSQYEILGIKTKPEHLTKLDLPKEGDLIAGRIGPGKKPKSVKLGDWKPVCSQYRLLIEMLQSPEKWVNRKTEALERLDMPEMEMRNYYVLIALALVFEDFEFIAVAHSLDTSRGVDSLIHRLSESLCAPEVWDAFKTVCAQHEIPSQYITNRDCFEVSFGSLAVAFGKK